MAKTRAGSGDNCRQHILNTALNLIMNRGVKETSISDIAREAGISKGTLSYHYPSKNSLVFDVTDYHFKQVTDALIAQLESMTSFSPEQLFETALKTVIYEKQRGQLNLYLVQNAVTGNNELRDRFREKYREWRGMVFRLLKEKYPHAVEETLRVYSYLVVAVMDGLIIQWLLEPDIPLKAVSEALARGLKGEDDG